MICQCSRPWLSHRPLSTVSNSSATPSLQLTRISTQTQPPINAFTLNSTRISTQTQPPITAFALNPTLDTLANRDASLRRIRGERGRGVNRVNAGQGGDRQRVVVQRSHADNARGSRGRIRGNRSASGGNTGRRVTSDGLRRQTNREAEASPSTTEFLALLLPFQVRFLSPAFSVFEIVSKLEEDRSDPSYTFSLPDIEQLISALRAHNLTCILSLPPEGEVWRIVSTQISNHLSNHNIATGVTSEPTAYFRVPMFLIHPNKKERQVTRRLFIESDLTAQTFTVAALTKASRMALNPEENSPHSILFFGMYCSHSVTNYCQSMLHLAPRYRNLWGPLPGENIQHACFPWRVWKNLQAISETVDNHEGDCVSACPGQASQRSRRRSTTGSSHSSSGEMPHRRIRRRVQQLSSEVSSQEWLRLYSDYTLVLSVTPPHLLQLICRCHSHLPLSLHLQPPHSML
jgi:hypothetical protein